MDIENAKDLMVENIDKILEREEKVEMMVKKTAQITQLSKNIQ